MSVGILVFNIHKTKGKVDSAIVSCLMRNLFF